MASLTVVLRFTGWAEAASFATVMPISPSFLARSLVAAGVLMRSVGMAHKAVREILIHRFSGSAKEGKREGMAEEFDMLDIKGEPIQSPPQTH